MSVWLDVGFESWWGVCLGLCNIVGMDGFQATLVKHVLEDQAADIDGPARGGVVHRAQQAFVVQHCWRCRPATSNDCPFSSLELRFDNGFV